MRRRQSRRFPETQQRALEFPAAGAPSAPRPAAPLDDWFQADDPRGLFVGEERLEQYLRRNGMAWVVRLRAVLEELDYSLLTGRYDVLGRKAFHPRTLLGLIVYGIVHKQSSLRELEVLAVRDVGAWWLCGGKQPDHSTIGKFIQLHGELLSVEFFTALTAYLVRRLRLQAGTVAGDGTVIEAAASRYGLLKAEAAQVWAAEAARAAAQHPEDPRRQARAAQGAELARVAAERRAKRERAGKAPEGIRVARTEPSAVVQPTKVGTYRPAYKPSLLVHPSRLIVGQAVQASSERAALAPMLHQHEGIFGGDPTRLLLDGGYFAIDTLAGLSERGIDVLCPPGKARTDMEWEKPGPRGKFSKAQFLYDPERDQYRCPGGHWLSVSSRGRDHHGQGFAQYRTAACSQCALRVQCTASRTGRTVKRYAGEEYAEAMRAVLQQARARQAYGQRSPLVEPLFAVIRERHGLNRFHRRGVRGVRVEWALHCIAFNLTRAVGTCSFVVLILELYCADRPSYCVAVVAILAACAL